MTNREQQKWKLALLSVFSLAIIFFSLRSLSVQIKNPFVLDNTINSDVVVAPMPEGFDCPDGTCFDSNELVPENYNLRSVDTDKDGINDWDELFVHETSPYLVDSDGDGFSDYDEIFVHSTDPLDFNNYPANVIPLLPVSDNSLLEGDFVVEDEEVIDSSLDPVNLGANQGSEEELMLLLESLGPDEIRQLLVDGGLEQAEVDKLADDDLMLILFEVFQSVSPQ